MFFAWFFLLSILRLPVLFLADALLPILHRNHMMTMPRRATKCLRFATITALSLNLLASTIFAEQSQLQPTAPEAVGMDSGRIERVTDELQALVNEGRVAGMVTIAARDGKIVHSETLGVQDIATGEPMAEDTIFRLFSTFSSERPGRNVHPRVC